MMLQIMRVYVRSFTRYIHRILVAIDTSSAHSFWPRNINDPHFHTMSMDNLECIWRQNNYYALVNFLLLKVGRANDYDCRTSFVGDGRAADLIYYIYNACI